MFWYDVGMPRLLKSRLVWVVLVMTGLAAGVLWHLSAPGSVTIRYERRFPFQLEFGRGSGWHGLNTVKIFQDGTVTLHELQEEIIRGKTYPYWQMTSFKLSDEAMAEVVEAVGRNRLSRLSSEYHGNVADGTQWVLWFEQDGMEKSVYCDNRFPDEVVHFAKNLDDILARNGLEQAKWQRVNDADGRKHERKLWDSIKGSP
jgi:hypothetical protein